MEVHEAAGNPAEALRAFDELRQLLRDELGTTPGPAVMALHARLLRGDGPPARGAAASTAAPGPLPAAARGGDRAATRSSAARRRSGALHEAWDAAVGDERRLVLLAGEAGIGKSRLAAEFTRTVHRDGAVVLFGRFDETGPGAYQPVLEMLRGWSGGAALTGPAQRLGPRAADLAALLPELGRARGRRAIQSEAGIERQRLFDALAALLAEIAAGAPLLLVIDDLQWADSPTLQLLRHLMRAPQPRRTMFLGTYREAEVGEDHPLPRVIASLRREGMLTQVPLDGLAPRRGRRARRGARRRGAVAGLRLRAARGDRGQPVLRRGGRAAPRETAATSRTPACRRACARSPRGGSRACPRARARRCRSRA